MAGKGPKSSDTGQTDLFSLFHKEEDPFAPPKDTLPVGDLITDGAERDDDDDDDSLDDELEAPRMGPKVWSVSEISGKIRDTLRDEVGEVLIRGEIADFKGVNRSGHLYFALKDDKSQIRAVIWKTLVGRIPFEVKGGLEVIAHGRIDYYSGSGSLQIIVDHIEPVGIGALQLKFEQLKEKLKLEGLFEDSRKRRIPALNWQIGIVTGKSTAALQDMIKVYRQRFRLAKVFVFDSPVQGDKAPVGIVAAIERANAWSAKQARPLDVLVIARGGGSYEDLFCFNDESVARAIVRSKIPTVSGIGHEIDITIADMVADRRAATPSNAAELTSPDTRQWLERLADIEKNFSRRIRDQINDLRLRVDGMSGRLVAASPLKKIETQLDVLKRLGQRYEDLMRNHLQRRKSEIARLASVMDALSPLRVLERGYSIVLGSKGQVVRAAGELSPGDDINIRLHKGEISAKVQ